MVGLAFRARWAAPVLAGTALLAACGGSSSSSTTAATTTATTVATTTTASASSGASSVSIGDGVSVTPASGWRVVQHQGATISLADAAGDAFYVVAVGQATASDVSSQLQTDIQSDMNTTNNKDYTDIQVQGTPRVQDTSIQTKFDKAASVPFTATGTGSTGPVVGLYGELLNTQTANSAFVIYFANGSTAEQEHMSEAGQMNRSLER